MAPHSSTLAWKIPWSPWGRQELDTTERLHFHFSLSCIGEGNGNPLQCSCLENPRDGGAWWAAVSGVTQSWTRLKRLSSSSSSNVSRQSYSSKKCLQYSKESVHTGCRSDKKPLLSHARYQICLHILPAICRPLVHTLYFSHTVIIKSNLSFSFIFMIGFPSSSIGAFPFLQALLPSYDISNLQNVTC